MNIKATLRKYLQGKLSHLPRKLHRYILSLYSNVPEIGLRAGFHVLRDLGVGQSSDLAASLHYFTHSPLLQRILNDSEQPVIFDVGANIGQTCSSYAAAFPKCTIHAFEPFQENITYLRESCVGLVNIYSHHLAMSEEEGTMEVMRDHHPLSQWNSISPAYQNELAERGKFTMETIRLKRGDRFCEENSIARIALLKIDTEGHEMGVLRGFEPMFDKGRVDCCLIEVGFGNDKIHGHFQILNEFMRRNRMMLCGFHDTDYKADGTMNFSNAFYCQEKWL